MVYKESPSRPILLKFLQVECHVSPSMTIEFFEWTHTNKYGCLWYCSDLSQSPILQQAIEKAMKK